MIEKLKRQSFYKLLVMIWNVFRMTLLKVRKWNKIDISLLQNIAPDTIISIKDGHLKLSNSVFTRRGVTIRVESGFLSIGTSFFNQGCSITVRKKVCIGNNCLFGPNVVVVDHDHDYSCPNEKRGIDYMMEEVSIGNNVVVGANTVILKGSSIGDNCMIGAGCILSGIIPAGTLVYNERVQRSRPIQFRSGD